MGVIRNIKASIDDKSSMSVNSITLLASAIMGIIIGLVICFVLIYDVTYDGKVDTNLTDMRRRKKSQIVDMEEDGEMNNEENDDI